MAWRIGCSVTGAFNPLAGTPLALLRRKGKWMTQVEAMRGWPAIRQARWRHRFLILPQTLQAQTPVGITKTDETYFFESSEGRCDLTRKARTRGGKASKRGLPMEQTLVLIYRDRSGNTDIFVLDVANKAHIVAILTAYDPRLKSWMSGIKRVSKHYLSNYLRSFRALDSTPGFSS